MMEKLYAQVIQTPDRSDPGNKFVTIGLKFRGSKHWGCKVTIARGAGGYQSDIEVAVAALAKLLIAHPPPQELRDAALDGLVETKTWWDMNDAEAEQRAVVDLGPA